MFVEKPPEGAQGGGGKQGGLGGTGRDAGKELLTLVLKLELLRVIGGIYFRFSSLKWVTACPKNRCFNLHQIQSYPSDVFRVKRSRIMTREKCGVYRSKKCFYRELLANNLSVTSQLPMSQLTRSHTTFILPRLSYITLHWEECYHEGAWNEVGRVAQKGVDRRG